MLSTINDPLATPLERLDALTTYLDGDVEFPEFVTESNNHVHTIYSFSPYTPAMAALKAREAGLMVVGSVDHDSAAGAPIRQARLKRTAQMVDRGNEILGRLGAELIDVETDIVGRSQFLHTECPTMAEVIAFALSIGAIPCYAYLGDVTASPTGDKKAAKFEDDFLEELFVELRRLA